MIDYTNLPLKLYKKGDLAQFCDNASFVNNILKEFLIASWGFFLYCLLILDASVGGLK